MMMFKMDTSRLEGKVEGKVPRVKGLSEAAVRMATHMVSEIVQNEFRQKRRRSKPNKVLKKIRK